MSVYYNDIDPYCAQWLRNLIAAGHLPAGEVDERPIQSVAADDVRRFRQCHFFAGIGGWPLALRLAGWHSNTTPQVWSGSCPCQPFSIAGKGKGKDDDRHLWPDFFRLIEQCRPPVIFGEQVASQAGLEWLSGLRTDMETIGYAVGAANLCAAGVGAPHSRQRLYWVADSSKYGRERVQRCITPQVSPYWTSETLDAWHSVGNPFEDWKKLLAETRIDMLDDGVSSAMAVRPSLRAYGNAIVPQVAQVFIESVMECMP